MLTHHGYQYVSKQASKYVMAQKIKRYREKKKNEKHLTRFNLI